MRHLYRIHDALTEAGAALSAVCVAIICFSYCYEVVSRYFFNAPTLWASAATTYLLLASVTLMAPYVTRERSHVTISFIYEFVGAQRARYLFVGCLTVSAIICLLSVWFTGTEAARQFTASTMMMDSLLLTPKWVLSALIVYAFLSSSLYFVRQIPAAYRGEIIESGKIDMG